MGGSNSKEPDQQNFLRSPSKRASRRQRASSISLGLKQMRQKIESFDGYRDDPRYADFQAILTKSSQDIQDLKHKSKSDTQEFCDNVHADIVDLLRVLEQVVSKNERDLDSGAVESHSFINQTPNMKKKERPEGIPIPERTDVSPERSVKSESKYPERITNLDQLEQNVTKLLKEINNAIQIEDHKQFVVLEKKIKLLYTDLEMIEVEEHTPLHERKEGISRKLIRYNNKIKKAKTNSASQVDSSRNVSEEEKRRRIQKELQTIVPIERELEDLGVKVLTFDDVKGDAKYKALDQILKSHWTTLKQLEDSSESNRKRKLNTIELIKRILQELNNKAEENSNKIKSAIEKINVIEEDVLGLTKNVEAFNGTRNDEEYKNLDQKLRSLWAKLNDVHGSYERVEVKKEDVISNIQQMLKALLQNAQNNEKINQDATAKQVLSEENYNFLMQTKELQNHWNEINKIVVQKLSSSDKKDVVQVLDALKNEINKKIRDIQALSTNSFRGVDDLKNKIPPTESFNEVEDSKNVYIPIQSFKGSKENIQNHDQEEDELAIAVKTSGQPVEIKTLPTMEIFGQVQKIQVALKENKNQIKAFTGTKEDPGYYEIEAQVQQHKTTLENVPLNLSQIVDKARTKGLGLSQECLKLLEEKVEANKQKIADSIQERVEKQKVEEETSKLKAIIENLQRLKKKVDCFNGTYKNIQYVQIENELKSCLEKLDLLDSMGNDKIASSKTQLRDKIVQYLEILDERSLKVSSQEDLTEDISKELPYRQINMLRNKLTNIKIAMEGFVGQYKDSNYVRLEQELINCKKDINQVEDINHSVIVSKKQYSDYVDQLLIYFQEKLMAEKEDTLDGKEQQNPSTLLTHYQQEVSILRKEVDGLQYNITDAQYYDLDENLLQIMLKIDDVDVQDEALGDLRRQLIQELQVILMTLQSKKNTSSRNSATDNQISVVKVQEIEKEIQELTQRVAEFSENSSEQEFDSLDESISTIFLQIQSIETKGNPRIIEVCEELIKDVQNNQRILKQKVEGIGALQFIAKAGTEV